MNKLILTLLILYINLYSIEVNILPDSKEQVKQEEIAAVGKRLKSQRMIMETSDIKQMILDNRLLANEYLKSNDIKELIVNLRLETERALATRYVQAIQNDIKISDEALKSYYVSHELEFKRPADVNFTIVKFHKYDDAMKFYDDYKSKIHDIDLSEYNTSTMLKQLAFLNRDISGLLKKGSKQSYLLPPQFFIDHFSVIYIHNINPINIAPFEEVKEKIRSLLFEKIFKDEKRKIIESLRKGNK